MKKVYAGIAILFLIGMFLTTGNQDTDVLAETIGDGIEGGLDFLGTIVRSITD
jgi:hypothetical protein